MTIKTELGKVTAFITRATGTERELLVLQHPSAGIQLPAGTQEPGETPEAAVLRETDEETGLTAVSIVEYLDTIDEPLDDDERIVVARCTLQASPGADGTDYLGVHLRRGHRVRVISSDADYDQITYSEYALDGDALHVVSTRTGWLARRLLTSRVRRHFFHLTPTAPTPPRWTMDADGHTFTLFWVPLAYAVGLVSAQRGWLDHVRDRL